MFGLVVRGLKASCEAIHYGIHTGECLHQRHQHYVFSQLYPALYVLDQRDNNSEGNSTLKDTYNGVKVTVKKKHISAMSASLSYYQLNERHLQ